MRLDRFQDANTATARLLCHSSEVPLAEETRAVSFVFQYVAEGNLTQRQRFLRVSNHREKDARAERVPPSQHTGTRRTAHWCRGIKSLEDQPGLGHVVETRRSKGGIAVVAGITPTEIVGHHQNDIWAIRCVG